MPTSARENKNLAAKWYNSINPHTFVDVGPGEGTYGKLFNHKGYSLGIEAWGPYVEQYGLEAIYNEVVIADARFVDPELFRADLVVMGDMLEHMSKYDAKKLILTVKERAKNMIVCIPLIHLDQEPYEGNFFEIHKDHWHYDEMRQELLDGLVESRRGKILGYFWWKS